MQKIQKFPRPGRPELLRGDGCTVRPADPVHPISASSPEPVASQFMSFLARVVRGNVDQAYRQAMRAIQSNPQAKKLRTKQYNEKPTQRRRRERSEGKRRREKTALLSNLNVIFTRKARGF